ncbi:thiol peroxidase [bacterium]|nr:thiol peroxidase [bacterium]MBU1919163.1 thiol peroxidase [bacterium]
MAQTAFKGQPVQTSGDLPAIGSTVSDFCLVNNSLEEVSLSTFSGQRKVLNIFPSIDTPVCATSVRKFNELAAQKNNTVILCISADLPFALKRFCGAEGIEKVFTLSTFRDAFAKNYGVELLDSPLKGLCARSVIVLDENNKVLYTELAAEITQEPNYKQALQVLAA